MNALRTPTSQSIERDALLEQSAGRPHEAEEVGARSGADCTGKLDDCGPVVSLRCFQHGA